MSNEWNNQERDPQAEKAQQQDAPTGGQHSQQSEYGQQSQQGQFTAEGGQQSQAEAQNSAQQGFNDEETQGNQGRFSGGAPQDSGQPGSIGSPESFGQSDQQGSGFMAQQGSGSDDYLQNIGQGDLAQRDSLTQEDDGGAGEAAGEG